MDKEQVLSWLKDTCGNKEWFHSIGQDQYGRYVVYAKYINSEVQRSVPDWTEDGKQVLCHFAASAPDAKNDFVNKPQAATILPTFDAKSFMNSVHEAHKKGIDTGWAGAMGDEGDAVFAELAKKTAEEEDRQLELSVRVLTDELDRLEKLCGSNILGDIFFEEVDGKNAVTNLSARYPEVRERIHKLFIRYGFDVIYEELEL